MRTAVLSAIATLMAGAASAQTYHLIGTFAPGAVFIDSETVRPTSAGRSYWSTLFLFADGAEDPRTAFIMTHDEMDCGNAKSRHISIQAFDAHGQPTTGNETVTEWREVIPGSYDDTTRKLVCDGAALAADRAIQRETLQMLATVRELKDKFIKP